MKSQFQTLSFLNQYRPKSSLDDEMITGFVQNRFRITPKTIIFGLDKNLPSIDAQSFIQWFDNGYGASEIVAYKNSYAILGKCHIAEISIIGMLKGKSIVTTDLQESISNISKVNQQDTKKFQIELLNNKLQFNESTFKLDCKYIPENNEKVIFHNADMSINGLGVIRNIDPETYEVELYCYFLYPSKSNKRKIGFSMHETNIVNLHEFIFEPMMDADNRASSLNGVSCIKRLNRELNKEGKVWKDKLHRIEPISPKVQKGQKYWYISDKMKVVQELEKDTPTGHMRYLAGNYFIDQEAAIVMLGKIQSLIQDYLASTNWPKLEDK